jgi:acyl-CoA synthetase (AMP-forming)/AMP-acid ligase II
VTDRWDRDEALPDELRARAEEIGAHVVDAYGLSSDPEWGERVVAFAVPADGAAPPTLEALLAFAGDHLSRAQLPKQVVHVDEIPRTPGGKPLRRELRARR